MSRSQKRAPSRQALKAKPTTPRLTARPKVLTRQRLSCLVTEVGSQREFARQLREGDASTVDYSPRVSGWLSGRSQIGADNLRLIASRFDVSVDWLLGFDVPRRQSEKAAIGVLSDEIADAIGALRPEHAPVSITPQRDGSIVTALAAEWWSAQLRTQRESWRAAAVRLINELLDISAGIDLSGEERWWLSAAIVRAKEFASVLGSDELSWDELRRITVPLPLVARVSKDLGLSRGELRTPFSVAGGYGFACRRLAGDSAVYIDAVNRQVKRDAGNALLTGVPVTRGLLST